MTDATAETSTDSPTTPTAAPAESIMVDAPLTGRIEALLISADRPLNEARLGALLGLEGPGIAKRVREAIDELNAHFDETARAFRIEKIAAGWQILTRPEFEPLLSRLYQDRQLSRLSQAALETLSIIAYRQPILRAEIEAIRGVACGEVLRGLMDRRLVKIVGRAEELGRPMLYGTTREFLKAFGLANLDDLPEIEGLDRRPAYAPPPDPQPQSEDPPVEDAVEPGIDSGSPTGSRKPG